MNRNEHDENAEDIHNDVSQLADTLEEVLKSWGSDAKESGSGACQSAVAVKRDSCPPYGHNRVQQAALDARQAACDALGCADTYVRSKTVAGVGAAAAVGVFIGVCSIYVDNSLSVGCRRAIGAR